MLLPLIISETAASVLALPTWAPFASLVPSVAGLCVDNALLRREQQCSLPADPFAAARADVAGRQSLAAHGDAALSAGACR
jgi:hypothetical protein